MIVSNFVTTYFFTTAFITVINIGIYKKKHTQKMRACFSLFLHFFLYILTYFKRRQKSVIKKMRIKPQPDTTIHSSEWLKCWLGCNTLELFITCWREFYVLQSLWKTFSHYSLTSWPNTSTPQRRHVVGRILRWFLRFLLTH